MSDDTVWLLCYEERDNMDSHNWRKREIYAADNLDVAKNICHLSLQQYAPRLPAQ